MVKAGIALDCSMAYLPADLARWSWTASTIATTLVSSLIVALVVTLTLVAWFASLVTASLVADKVFSIAAKEVGR